MTSHEDVFDTPETRQPTILSVYNQKGGVGKTTTSVNLALTLAAMGKSVVLIDFDPQSSATSNFLLRDKAKVGINDLLRQETFVEDAITPTAFDGLSMIVLTTVVVLPMIQQAGFDLIWFGVFLVLMVEMAQITPPVGFNLFVLQTMSGRDSLTVARAALPFFFLLVATVVIITVFPDIVMVLPRMAFPG